VALAIDASSPAVATNTSNTIKTVTTASFTPPDFSTVVALWCGNSTLNDNPPDPPAITDSLAPDLAYVAGDWQSRNVTPTVNGQTMAWGAPVDTGAAMTVTVTSGTFASEFQSALQIQVLTGADPTTPVGAHGRGGSTSASAVAATFQATATDSWGFIAVTDWDALGSMTAGTGCTLIATGTIPTTQISYGFFRRTTPDGVNGADTAMNVNLAGSSSNVSWSYIEIVPPPPVQLIDYDPPPPFLPAYLTYQLAEMMWARNTHTTDNGYPQNLIADASPKAVFTLGPGAAVSPTFTAPTGTLITVRFAGNNATGAPPSVPTITDSLGTPLTYTLRQWQSRADSPTVDGQAAVWTAVSTGVPMTISVTGHSDAANSQCAIKVDYTTIAGCTAGVSGKAGSAGASSISQSYTASADGGQVMAAICDWTVQGFQTVGAGCVNDGTSSIGTSISWGFLHRAVADDVGGVSNSWSTTLRASSNNLAWVWLEVLPPVGSSTISGTATLTGAGALDAPATQSTLATLTGAGALTALAVESTGAAFSGVGVLTAAATQAVTAAPAGAGALSANIVESVTAALVGVGAVTAPVIESVRATLAGAGALTAPAVQGSAATPAGAGVLTATITESVTATVAGAGAVTAPVVESVTTTLTGAGVLIASSGSVVSGTATLVGTGALTALAVESTGAALTGAGTLTGAARQAATAAFTGAGTLAAASTESVVAAASGAGVLTAIATVSGSNTAILTGAGTLTANATLRTTATFAGAGALAAPATQSTTKTLAGAGALSAAGVITGSASLSAAGGLLAVVVQAAVNTGTGAGALVAAASVSGASCSTPRPDTGVTARPGAGTTAYALATTARPGSGITARPNTGVTNDPC